MMRVLPLHHRTGSPTHLTFMQKRDDIYTGTNFIQGVQHDRQNETSYLLNVEVIFIFKTFSLTANDLTILLNHKVFNKIVLF